MFQRWDREVHHSWKSNKPTLFTYLKYVTITFIVFNELKTRPQLRQYVKNTTSVLSIFTWPIEASFQAIFQQMDNFAWRRTLVSTNWIHSAAGGVEVVSSFNKRTSLHVCMYLCVCMCVRLLQLMLEVSHTHASTQATS